MPWPMTNEKKVQPWQKKSYETVSNHHFLMGILHMQTVQNRDWLFPRQLRDRVFPSHRCFFTRIALGPVEISYVQNHQKLWFDTLHLKAWQQLNNTLGNKKWYLIRTLKSKARQMLPSIFSLLSFGGDFLCRSQKSPFLMGFTIGHGQTIHPGIWDYLPYFLFNTSW